ncbi:MAG: hypothetical protein ACREH3_02520 [Geminicoccales bacterium]
MPIMPLPKARDLMAEPMAMADASGTGGERTRGASSDPLGRTIATWSQDDVRTVMSSPAYLRAQHPQHGEAQRLVRLWFEQAFGTGPAPADATGRMVREEPGRRSERVAKDGACPVPVRVHAREGGQVEARAHCRARPA